MKTTDRIRKGPRVLRHSGRDPGMRQLKEQGTTGAQKDDRFSIDPPGHRVRTKNALGRSGSPSPDEIQSSLQFACRDQCAPFRVDDDSLSQPAADRTTGISEFALQADKTHRCQNGRIRPGPKPNNSSSRNHVGCPSQARLPPLSRSELIRIMDCSVQLTMVMAKSSCHCGSAENCRRTIRPAPCANMTGSW